MFHDIFPYKTILYFIILAIDFIQDITVIWFRIHLMPAMISIFPHMLGSKTSIDPENSEKKCWNKYSYRRFHVVLSGCKAIYYFYKLAGDLNSFNIVCQNESRSTQRAGVESLGRGGERGEEL